MTCFSQLICKEEQELPAKPHQDKCLLPPLLNTPNSNSPSISTKLNLLEAIKMGTTSRIFSSPR